MSATDAIELCEALERAGVRFWVNGGWGVDALVGRQTREHRDLDGFVERRDVARLRTLLAAQGFADIPGGRPENFVLQDGAGREVDIHVFELDAAGNGRYPQADGTTWVCPAEGLSGTGMILGRRVRCFTPELQLDCHVGYELDEGDRHDVALLLETFPGIERLRTRVEPPNTTRSASG